MGAVGGQLVIKSGQSVSSSAYGKMAHALALAIRLPAGFQGVVGVRTSLDGQGAGEPFFYLDSGGTWKKVQIDPGQNALPAWFLVPVDVYPGHYVHLATFIDDTEAAPQVQGADRVIQIMGVAPNY